MQPTRHHAPDLVAVHSGVLVDLLTYFGMLPNHPWSREGLYYSVLRFQGDARVSRTNRRLRRENSCENGRSY
jgi:hypothetical protein